MRQELDFHTSMTRQTLPFGILSHTSGRVNETFSSLELKDSCRIGYGVTANIAASHAAARGSIPRIRTFFWSVILDLWHRSSWLLSGLDPLHFMSRRGCCRVCQRQVQTLSHSKSICTTGYGHLTVWCGTVLLQITRKSRFVRPHSPYAHYYLPSFLDV